MGGWCHASTFEWGGGGQATTSAHQPANTQHRHRATAHLRPQKWGDAVLGVDQLPGEEGCGALRRPDDRCPAERRRTQVPWYCRGYLGLAVWTPHSAALPAQS